MRDAMPGPITVGDRLPAVFGMDAGLSFYASEQQYGRAAVIVLAGSGAKAELPGVIGSFGRCMDAFATRNADLLLMLEGNPAILPACAVAVRAIDCGDFLARCGVGARQILVLVHDRNLRIALVVHPDQHPDTAQACLAALDQLPAEPVRDITMPAPAIILPNLLSPSMCRHLIETFESSPTMEGGIARIDAEGHVRAIIDQAKKRRRDMLIEPETALGHLLRTTLLNRCRPEIAKAFRASVAYADRILLARYDESGGWFRRHRDNDADHVAFREFALSVNLNTGEYEGGHLLFPEYNDHRVCPPVGAGLIFAASVLHEAAPVTSGSRYVLLTFFHGEAAEQRRLARSHATEGTEKMRVAERGKSAAAPCSYRHGRA